MHPIFFGEYSAFFDEVSQAFREIGYTIRPITRTIAEYIEARRKDRVDLIIGRWGADYPDADTFVHGVLHSREGFLGTMCGSPAMDELIERGRTETDPRVRHSVYRQVEETIARDALLLPLFHDQVYCFARPEVEGLSLNIATPYVSYEKLSVRR